MNENKTTVIQIKLSETEKKILKERANAMGLNISQYIRTKCIYKK